MPTDYATLAPLLKGYEVLGLFRSGSRLYGCAGPNSDEDFVAIVANGPRDLIRQADINIIVQSLGHFQSAIREHSIMAFETMFCPAEHRLMDAGALSFAIRVDSNTLVAKAVETSTSDYCKAEKGLATEVVPSQKKLYHSIRVLMFAIQILREGRITNYGEANPVWAAIADTPSDDWADYQEFSTLRARLVLDLAQTRRLRESFR